MKKNTRKLLAVVLSFVLLVAGIPVGGISAFASDEVPEGYIGVYNIEDLNNIRNNLTENYILMNDIDMTEATSKGGAYYNNGNGWKPIGENENLAFTGIFDGNSHTISGMRIRGIKTNYAGLFGYVIGEIRNLKLEDVLVSVSSLYTGGAVGYFKGTSISRVSVTGSVYSSPYDGYFGGVVGYCGSGLISECYNKANVSGKSTNEYCVGGIVGHTSGTVSDCYNAGTITGRPDNSSSSIYYYCGGIGGSYYRTSGTYKNCVNVGTVTGYRISAIANGTLSHCYYLSTTADKGVYGSTDTDTTVLPLTEEQIKNELNFGWLDFENTWVIDPASGVEYPQLINNREAEDSGERPEKPVYNDNLPEGWVGVHNIDELYAIRFNKNGKFALMNDIDLTEATAEGGSIDTGKGWLPIGNVTGNAFTGIFDGNGHTIKGMQIRRYSLSCAGLFGYVTGEIRNLNLEDVSVNVSSWYTGGAVGYFNGTSISRVSVTGSVHSYPYNKIGHFGGVVGKCDNSSALISECYNKADISGIQSKNDQYCAGGIVGHTTGTVSDCYNAGKITGSIISSYYICGGIGGSYNGAHGKYKNCVNLGAVTGDYRSAIAYGITLSHCYYLTGTADRGCYNKTDTADTAVKLTAEQITDKASFDYLDFDNTWFIDTNTGINHPQLLNNPEVVAENVEIKTPAEKTVYCLGDELDISGLTLSVKLANKDTIYTKTPTVSMVSGFDSETPGEKTLTVRYYNKAVTYNVTVLPVAPESITLNKTSAELERGQKVTLTVTLTPSDAADSITWTSSADTVASVDENGVVTALSAGEAVITAETINGLKAACTVTVNASSLPGDANGDGQINAADRMALSRYLAKMGELADPGAADLDGDGNVTAADRMILSRYLAKWSGYDSYFQA